MKNCLLSSFQVVKSATRYSNDPQIIENRDRSFSSDRQMALLCHVRSHHARPDLPQCIAAASLVSLRLPVNIRNYTYGVRVSSILYWFALSDMPPKKPAPATGSKKTQEKKKEKIIEVKFFGVQHSCSMLNTGPCALIHFLAHSNSF